MARLPLLNLREARSGQKLAGRRLAAELAARLRSGGLTADETEVLASMLDAVAAGTDANVALHVKQRGAPSSADRDYWIWRRVNELICSDVKRAAAFRAVVNECAVYGERITEKTVSNIFYKWNAARREGEESA